MISSSLNVGHNQKSLKVLFVPKNRNLIQAGFTYIGLLIIIAIMGVTLAGIGTVWHTSQQRFREKQLLFIGNQYSKAITAFYQNSPGEVKQYPKKLEDLLQDNRYPTTERYLRKLFADPITDSDKWGLIKTADGSIAGVYSLSEAEPIKKDNFPKAFAKFVNKMHYSEWKFTNLANGYAPMVSSATPMVNGGNTPQAPKVPPAYQVPPPDQLPADATPEQNNLWECQSQRILDAATCLQQSTKYGDITGLACMGTANQRYAICITPGHGGLPPLYLLFK
jgi:type II secretory pathway pseudopilin PulG